MCADELMVHTNRLMVHTNKLLVRPDKLMVLTDKLMGVTTLESFLRSGQVKKGEIKQTKKFDMSGKVRTRQEKTIIFRKRQEKAEDMLAHIETT